MYLYNTTNAYLIALEQDYTECFEKENNESESGNSAPHSMKFTQAALRA